MSGRSKAVGFASPFRQQHGEHMTKFRTLADDHPDLARSRKPRGALLLLHYAQEHGSIGPTKAKAFKRVFVHWAVEQIGWPGKTAEEMFRYNKVITEYEFPPLGGLHYLRLGPHYKGEFRLKKRARSWHTPRLSLCRMTSCTASVKLS